MGLGVAVVAVVVPTIVHETIVPDALALERVAVLVRRLLAEEGEGPTGDVERERHRGVSVVEGQESVLW